MYGLSLCETLEDVQSYVRNTLLWYQAKARSNVQPIISLSEPSLVSSDVDDNFDPSLLLTSNAESLHLDEADLVLQVAKEVMHFLLEARALEFLSVASFSLPCSNVLKGSLET